MSIPRLGDTLGRLELASTPVEMDDAVRLNRRAVSKLAYLLLACLRLAYVVVSAAPDNVHR